MNLTTSTHEQDQAVVSGLNSPATVEPVRDPITPPEQKDVAAKATASSADDAPAAAGAPAKEPIKWFGVTLPEPMANGVRSFQSFGGRWRKGAIEKTPGFIVNHSSNFIGAIQLVAEGLMFKSGGFDLVTKGNEGKPLHYLIDPPKNILDGVFKKGGLGAHPFQAEFYTTLPKRLGNFFKRAADLPKVASDTGTAFRLLKDTEAATIRDRVAASGELQKLTNKWSARSGFAGICAMTIATLLPDKKDTPEETEKYAVMARENPLRYGAVRMGQALNPIQWWNHKRQFSGLGMMGAGILSFVSGFRQVAGSEIGKQFYMRNGWQMAGGAITAIGGTQLLLAIDNETGWRNFGLIQMMRLGILPNSIATRFKGVKITPEQAAAHGFELTQTTGKATGTFQEQGAAYYLGAQGFLQGKNIFAASVGGAEKREDGTIVDHTEIRRDAAKKAKEKVALHRKQKKEKRAQKEAEKPEKEAQPVAKDATVKVAADVAEASALADPSNIVTQPQALEKAMPEREAPMMQQESALAV